MAIVPDGRPKDKPTLFVQHIAMASMKSCDGIQAVGLNIFM